MEYKPRPVVVAIITTMGAIIAALITSGYFNRTSAEKREDALEAKVKSLEAELKKRSEPAIPPVDAQTTTNAAQATATTHLPVAEPSEIAQRLAKEKNGTSNTHQRS